MKLLILLLFSVIPQCTYTLIIKDPKLDIPVDTKITNIHEVIPAYNPYSLYVPSTNILKQLPADRVLDMGASAFSISFFMKALYFYTNAISLFPDEGRIVAWASYEAGFIHYRKRQYDIALEYFNKVLDVKGPPLAAESLAKTMINRIVNADQYKVFLKQEDILFVEDKKAQTELNRQISKEEKAAEKVRRELVKERKKREKAEAKALKEEEKTRKQAEKEAQMAAKEAANKAVSEE